MIEIIIFSTAFLTSYAGVAAFRHFGSRIGMLDVPNERSLHETPTPRGGGLIIVITSLLLYYIISLQLNTTVSWGYAVGALLIAIVSWLDDLYSISSIVRFLIHSAAAFIVVLDLGHWNSLYVPAAALTLNTGMIGLILTILWVVWMINAYNFMDGIDGIAGLQAVLASAGWVIFGFIFGYEFLYLFAGVFLFANLGFLIHNWSPAKIFMGDVGSAFLGFTFAALPLMARKEKPADEVILPVIAVSFVWFFVFDTVLTFFKRLFKKQKVWTAHREHLYQQLVLSGCSHGIVAAFYGFLTVAVVVSAILFAVFRGNFDFLLLSTIILFTAVLLIAVFRKKY